tara:strand:- start:55 stop:822 length:768 start_codon:yes stop_codon:yes gene_type:complete
MDAMGCMLLRECTNGVDKVESIARIADEYPDIDFDFVANEFNSMLLSLKQIGVEVFLADSKYFPIGHRGVYHTVSNNFFLNKAFMHRPHVLMSVMRHEGWHAAQDCMAGTIDNSLVAIILPEDSVPSVWRKMVESTYPSAAVPWEAEASWAGKTEGMTQKALESCAAGTMWSDYEPTPMTREWLQENNYLPHIEYDFYFYPKGYYRHHHHNYQRHKHVHYHWRKDIIHSHKHSHGEGHRHHGRSSRHSRSKFHFH